MTLYPWPCFLLPYLPFLLPFLGTATTFRCASAISVFISMTWWWYRFVQFAGTWRHLLAFWCYRTTDGPAWQSGETGGCKCQWKSEPGAHEFLSQEGSILSVSAPNRFLVILIILVITMTRNNRHASAARSNGLFFVYAAHFLRPLCGDSACLYCSPRTEHLLIYRIQSHTHPKRRKFCLKHAGQKSVKDKLPEQRKGPKRAVECWLKVQTHVWEQDAGSSSLPTRTNAHRSDPPVGAALVAAKATPG